jgi:hypothetical protein
MISQSKLEIDIEAVVQARRNGSTLTQIADSLGVARSTLRERIKLYEKETGEDVETPVDEKKIALPKTVEEAMKVFNEYIGYKGKPPKAPKGKDTGKAEKKILLINDLHVPYHDMAAVGKVIDAHSADTDLLVIGGDFLDLFSVSRYEKFKQHYTLVEELRIAKALMNVIASKFKKIVVLSGNHDERWRKHLVSKRGMPPSELSAMNLLAQMASGDDNANLTDPLYCLTRDLTNVEVAAPVVSDFAEFGFFHQIGDLVVSHAEKFSRVPNQAANQALHWFMSNAIPMGLVKPFKVMAQCHTHQAGMTYGDYGVWTMECGCLARTPDYAANPRLMGAQRPAVKGCTVFYQDQDGKTDMTRSRFIPIED